MQTKAAGIDVMKLAIAIDTKLNLVILVQFKLDL